MCAVLIKPADQGISIILIASYLRIRDLIYGHLDLICLNEPFGQPVQLVECLPLGPLPSWACIDPSGHQSLLLPHAVLLPDLLDGHLRV